MRAAIYTRVSTAGQAERSVPAQLAACERYAADQGWTVVARYTDERSAWSGEARPGVEDAERAANAGDFDVLVVDSFDRLSRGADRESVLGMSFRFMPARVVSVSEPTPVDGVARTIMLAIHGETAHQESVRKSERAKRGAEGRKARGLPPGRAPLGYRVDGERLVEDERAWIVRRIFAEAAAGQSQQGIARGLDRDGVPSVTGARWSQAGVRSILRNTAYVGRKWNGPPLVDDATFEAVQARRCVSRKGGGRESRSHLLSRMLVCSCGERMLSRSDGAYQAYFCPRANGKVRGDCRQRPLKRSTVDDAVLEHFRAHGVDTAKLQAELDQLRAVRRADLESARDSARVVHGRKVAAVELVTRDYLDGRLDAAAWATLKALAEQELVAAERTLAEAEVALVTFVDADHEDLDAYVRRMLDGLRGDVPAARARLRSVFDRFDLVHGDPDSDRWGETGAELAGLPAAPWSPDRPHGLVEAGEELLVPVLREGLLDVLSYENGDLTPRSYHWTPIPVSTTEEDR